MRMSMSISRTLFPAFLWTACLYHGPVDAQETDQAALARQLLGRDIATRQSALAAAEALAPQQTGVPLRSALFIALEQEGLDQRARYWAGRGGRSVGPAEDPDLFFDLARVVARLRDPAAIPGLATALGTGSVVEYALTDFGEQAAPMVLDVVQSSESTHYQVQGGLATLKAMVEEGRLAAPGTMAAVRRAAEERLAGEQYFTVLWYAIDLAVVLDDAVLRRIVESLANDQDSVRARGITDPELIVETQQLAAKRLAGR